MVRLRTAIAERLMDASPGQFPSMVSAARLSDAVADLFEAHAVGGWDVVVPEVYSLKRR